MSNPTGKLNLLEWYSDVLHAKDYEEIKSIISDALRFIPLATAKLHKGGFIERVRVNRNGNLFYRQQDVSYVKGEAVISKSLKNYGRANKPYEPLFYGSMSTSQIEQARATAVMETVKILRDKEAVNTDGLICTLSRWEILEELLIVEMVFSDEGLKKSPETLKAFNHHKESIESREDREFMHRLSKFISNQFARQVDPGNEHEYKISVAFADLIFSKTDYKAIAFPSVQSDYKGYNIVMKPETVDKYLKLNLVGTLRIFKNKMQSLVSNHKNVSDFGPENNAFIWVDTDLQYVNTPEQVRNMWGL